MLGWLAGSFRFEACPKLSPGSLRCHCLSTIITSRSGGYACSLCDPLVTVRAGPGCCSNVLTSVELQPTVAACDM